MADELQALLDRITDEELKKADGEKDKILENARAEAAEIVRQAKQKAAGIVDDAGKEAAMLTQKGEEALKQASRDVLISLRTQLEERVSKAVNNLMRANMSGATLAPIIAKLVEGFAKSDGEIDDLKVLLPADDIQVLEKALKGELSDELQKHCELSPSPSIAGGFKLVFKESGVVYDFTDESLTATIASFLSPKIAGIITG